MECYNRGGNNWIACPRLKHKKGSLAGTVLNDKIFAIGGGDGSSVFSEVEMFDPALGRWIDSLSMRQNVWCTVSHSLSRFFVWYLVEYSKPFTSVISLRGSTTCVVSTL